MTDATVRRPRFKFMTMLGVFLLVTVGLLSGCTSRELGGRDHGLINNERGSRGIPGLAWDDNAAAKAQAWANQLAAAQALAHSRLSDGISGDWRILGENVGFADSVDAAHRGFMASAKHRANILNGAYSAVGVGVARNGNTWYVVEVFRG